LIGCGDIACQRVAPALRDGVGCTLAAVSRARAELAESFAREFGAPRWHADWNELVRDPGIDAVYVATPVDLRRTLPEFTVHVQAWDRSPVGMAMDFMGSEEFLVKTIVEPAFVHELMRRIVDEDLEWSGKRKALLERSGFPVESSISPETGSTSVMNSAQVNIIADEVNMPMMSPAVYEDLAFPYVGSLSSGREGSTVTIPAAVSRRSCPLSRRSVR